MKIHEIISRLEEFAPLSLQEDYDNSGLIIGNMENEVSSILCTVDVTADVIEEAIKLGADLIISHHPVIFKGIKKLTGQTYTELIVIKAIKNNISIYALHTNIDNSIMGVNAVICKKLGLLNCKVLLPLKDYLYKLATYVPETHADQVRKALFEAGAGNIGNYDNCSYNISGKGTFRGNENTKPFVGKIGETHFENEIRIEVIVAKHQLNRVIQSLLQTHPYEEVAYDVFPLKNDYTQAGSGMIGIAEQPLKANELLEKLKNLFFIPVVRYSGNQDRLIKKIAVCGGSGSFLIDKAIKEEADAFITSDIKYHQFFDTENLILLCDIGHFESEQFTKELFYTFLTKKFSIFAVHLSKVVTNPIKYYM